MSIDFFGAPERKFKFGRVEKLHKILSKIHKLTPELVDSLLYAHSKINLNLVNKINSFDEQVLKALSTFTDEELSKLRELLNAETIEEIIKKYLITDQFKTTYKQYFKNFSKHQDIKNIVYDIVIKRLDNEKFVKSVDLETKLNQLLGADAFSTKIKELVELNYLKSVDLANKVSELFSVDIVNKKVKEIVDQQIRDTLDIKFKAYKDSFRELDKRVIKCEIALRLFKDK